VYFSQNRNISDISIQLLAQRCPLLQRIFIDECPQISDSSIYALSNFCALEQLSLRDCHSITDDSVKYLINSKLTATSLTLLNLKQCNQITWKSLSNLTHYALPNLKYINLRGYLKIDENNIERLRLFRKDLEIQF